MNSNDQIKSGSTAPEVSKPEKLGEVAGVKSDSTEKESVSPQSTRATFIIPRFADVSKTKLSYAKYLKESCVTLLNMLVIAGRIEDLQRSFKYINAIVLYGKEDVSND